MSEVTDVSVHRYRGRGPSVWMTVDGVRYLVEPPHAYHTFKGATIQDSIPLEQVRDRQLARDLVDIAERMIAVDRLTR